MIGFEWSDEVTGQFINLRAFTEHRAFRAVEARLPDWETIQADLPQLIHPAAGPAKRYFISHRWDHKDHPDPDGWQLRALVNLGKHYNFSGTDICVWYDYMSLPQRRPRSRERNRIFSAGLKNIRRTVARCENICLVSQNNDDNAQALDVMLHRGWIVFELYIARSRMKRPLPLYERAPAMVEFGRAQYGWDAVVPDIQAIAPVDTSELLHIWLQKRNIACTNGSDLKLLAGFLHEELTQFEVVGVAPKVELDTRVTLTSYEMEQLAFLTANGRSMRFPELFLDPEYDYEPKTGLWNATLRRRPLLPAFGSELDIGTEDLVRLRIDPETGVSAMYPGIRFNVSDDGRRMGFEVS